ncbi:LysR family transcriptional regulator [Streptomyces sp. NPDC050560]|uniref:LysR family transcriptional regulator n=1 Tax=Streptomyces sp. NPDC050560 TaxID=3365630 RepID=UPI00378B8A63
MALRSRMPSLDSLEVLVAVARWGSLSGAARERGVTEQAISSRVRSLESQTGLPLVVRGRLGTTLTPDGTEVLGFAHALLAAARDMDDRLAELRNDRRRRLRVSASFTIAEHLLPQWLAALQQDARERGVAPLDIHFDSSNWTTVIDRVVSGQTDLGFVGGPSIPEGVRSRVVAADELMLVVVADHPWARTGRRLDATDLLRAPLVAREEGSGQWATLKVTLAATLGDEARPAEPTMVLPTTAAVLAAVRSGAGPAILSSLAVDADLRDGRLHRIPIDGIDLRRSLRAVWLGPKVPPSGAVRDFLTFVTSQAAARRR